MPRTPLTLSVTAGALRPHRRGRTLDVRLEARVGDELVWECDSVYLSRGQGTEDAPRRDAPPALPVGTAVARWRLPEDLGRSYAGVSGDVNPIHLHALSAKAMGFPRPIAHGMWTYARTLAALGRTSLGPSQQQRVVHHTGVPAEYRGARRRPRPADGSPPGCASAKDADQGHLVLTLEGRDPLRTAP